MTKTLNCCLTKKIQETKNTFIWQLTPLNGGVFNFKPGQFVMIKLNKQGKVWKKPYSIASAPQQKKYFEFGIKVCGKFTNALNKIKIKEIIKIQGPYGKFIYDIKKDINSVMFAGGIGVTPFISACESIVKTKTKNKILLYYCNQNHTTIAYQKKLNKLSKKNKKIKIVYSIDQNNCLNWQGETGFINEQKIKKYINNLQSKKYFLCGPPGFIKLVENILLKNKVPPSKIKKEAY